MPLQVNRISRLTLVRATFVAFVSLGSLAQLTTLAEDGAEGKQPGDVFRSMPFDTSPYPALPVVYGEWHGVNLAFRTSPELVRQLLPEPLKPDATPWGSQLGDAVLVTQDIFTVVKPYRFNYRNSCLMIPATFEGKLGLYMVRVYEDAEDPTLLSIWGRETLGMPKLAGRTAVERDGEHVRSSLRTFGPTTLDLAFTLTGDEVIEAPMTWALYCRKTIPSPDNPREPDLDRLIEVPWRQTTETQLLGKVERFTVKLELRGELVELPIKEMFHVFWRSHPEGTVLDKGRTVHDYLR